MTSIEYRSLPNLGFLKKIIYFLSPRLLKWRSEIFKAYWIEFDVGIEYGINPQLVHSWNECARFELYSFISTPLKKNPQHSRWKIGDKAGYKIN